MTPLLVAKNIKKTFSQPIELSILNGIDLCLHAGESIAIMGASGEGKSTLLHILGTLEPPTSGELEICGHQVTVSEAAKLRNRYIGFIFQAYHLLTDVTVLHNVLIPAQISGASITKGSPAYKRALDLLDHVGLSPRAHFLAKFLSGGEKQRVAIARALMNDTRLLLADEPSGNLDHTTSTHIHELLLQTAKQHNKGLLIVTHDTELAKLCDKRLILREGKIYNEDVREASSPPPREGV